jgi:hypothetical protein
MEDAVHGQEDGNLKNAILKIQITVFTKAIDKICQDIASQCNQANAHPLPMTKP